MHNEMRTTHSITTKLGSFVPIAMLITWLFFGEILLETCVCVCEFILKISDCVFFKVKLFGHISRMVGLIDVKWNGSALVGYWVHYVTLTFDLTHDLDFEFFKVKFWNGCVSGIVGLIDVKWKGSELIRYWTDRMTLLFDHTHDLDLEVSRSDFEIALSQEWDGRLPWNIKHVSCPFMTMILTFVLPWWDGWMYMDSAWMTSDIGMLLTYLVVVVIAIIRYCHIFPLLCTFLPVASLGLLHINLEKAGFLFQLLVCYRSTD